MPVDTSVDAQHWNNDESIGSQEFLLRRISPERIRPHPNKPGQYIASEQAFRTFEMSVYVSSQTTSEAVLANYPNDSLVKVPVAFVRDSLKLIVVRDPKDDNPNPAHRLVGRVDHVRISKSAAGQMAEIAEWVVLNPPAAE